MAEQLLRLSLNAAALILNNEYYCTSKYSGIQYSGIVNVLYVLYVPVLYMCKCTIAERFSLNAGPGQQLILHQYWKYCRARPMDQMILPTYYNTPCRATTLHHKKTNTKICKYTETKTQIQSTQIHKYPETNT